MSGKDNIKDVVQRRPATRLEPDTLPREKLPNDLQKIVDNEESLLDRFYDGTSATQDSLLNGLSLMPI